MKLLLIVLLMMCQTYGIYNTKQQLKHEMTKQDLEKYLNEFVHYLGEAAKQKS